ncbi:RmlC-like cupin domain-containing protein [Mycena alexandri]|uniref:RmlC-like cupin domain-containing protein n=1 Tax=Mycena alexandri TaxID=1745969 RepID=A0AAD6WXK2_9AGAR|nr:RmlC-like cupin domain-containing protein [Mycena alexandri]
MFFRSTTLAAALSCMLSVRAAVPLKSAPSVDDRLKLLLGDGSGNLLTGDALRQLTVFDFNNQPAGSNGGSILLATIDNFPILTDLGISGAISIVEPCGLNIPHLHPRADEFFTVIEGQLETGLVQENGFNTLIQTELGKYQATVFPAGSLHYQTNPTCSPAVFVASLNSEDPGRSDIVTSYWMLPADVVDAALGFPETIGAGNIDAWRAHIPANLAAGVDTCLQACGLSRPGSSASASGTVSSLPASSSAAGSGPASTSACATAPAWPSQTLSSF